MVKKRRSYRRRTRVHRRRSKFTLARGMKVAIAILPEAAHAVGAYHASGGGMTGLTRGVLPSISGAYTGYNTNDGHFYANDLVRGYVPLFAAWVFGKVNSRVRVF